jgi:hypothetical protein
VSEGASLIKFQPRKKKKKKKTELNIDIDGVVKFSDGEFSDLDQVSIFQNFFRP